MRALIIVIYLFPLRKMPRNNTGRINLTPAPSDHHEARSFHARLMAVGARSCSHTHRLRRPPAGWAVGPVHGHPAGGTAAGGEGAGQKDRLTLRGMELCWGAHRDGGERGGNKSNEPPQREDQAHAPHDFTLQHDVTHNANPISNPIQSKPTVGQIKPSIFHVFPCM